MHYTVTWRPSALNHLAELWMASSNRHAITRASHQIDQSLRSNPHEVGEARLGVTRILFQGPLGAYFDVSDDDRLVNVWAVWLR